MQCRQQRPYQQVDRFIQTAKTPSELPARIFFFMFPCVPFSRVPFSCFRAYLILVYLILVYPFLVVTARGATPKAADVSAGGRGSERGARPREGPSGAGPAGGHDGDLRGTVQQCQRLFPIGQGKKQEGTILKVFSHQKQKENSNLVRDLLGVMGMIFCFRRTAEAKAMSGQLKTAIQPLAL